MDDPNPDRQQGGGPLLAGGLAAILASTCCIGPLVLVALGFSGAWIGDLTALEPYHPIFLAAALTALALAGWRIFRPARACQAGQVCARPRLRALYRVVFWIVAGLVFIAFGFPYLAPLFY